MPDHLKTVLAACAICLSIVIAPASLATSVVQQPISKISALSPLVFEGKVAGINVSAEGKRIYTWVTFEVLDVVKGEYEEELIELRYLGGSYGGRTLHVHDQTIPQFGEQGIYFLESLEGQSAHPLRGWGQGHYILQPDPNSNDFLVYNSERKLVQSLTSVEQVSANSIQLNAHTAGGVGLASSNKALPSQPRLSRHAFKNFIKEAAQ